VDAELREPGGPLSCSKNIVGVLGVALAVLRELQVGWEMVDRAWQGGDRGDSGRDDAVREEVGVPRGGEDREAGVVIIT
jgi:hypothetical protein